MTAELLVAADKWQQAEFAFSLAELASCSSAPKVAEEFIRHVFAGAWLAWFQEEVPPHTVVPRQAAEYLFGVLRRYKAPPAKDSAKKHAAEIAESIAKRRCVAGGAVAA